MTSFPHDPSSGDGSREVHLSFISRHKLPITIPSTNSNAFTLTVDLNGDGILDLVSNPSGGIAVRLGNGDGTFQVPAIYDSTDVAAGMVAGDFNADGKVDVAFLAIGASSTSLTLLLGNGDGSFQNPLHFLLSAASWDLSQLH